MERPSPSISNRSTASNGVNRSPGIGHSPTTTFGPTREAGRLTSGRARHRRAAPRPALSNGSPTQRCRLFTSRTGANISSSGHGNDDPSLNAASHAGPRCAADLRFSRAGACSAIRTAAASHSRGRQPLTTCPTRAMRPAEPSSTSRGHSNRRTADCRWPQTRAAGRAVRIPLVRRAAAMIASW